MAVRSLDFGPRWGHAVRQNSGTANIASVRDMLTKKDAGKLTAVLQLPLIGWPENRSVRNLPDYSHALPFLLDRSTSETRWSYGLNRRDPVYYGLQTIMQSGLILPPRFNGWDSMVC
jgi:hypothetical protein